MRQIDLRSADVARSDTIGFINRQLVLNYIRERGLISRAELARQTALQRSTISRIVDGLMSEGLVEELQGETSGGRPPSLFRLRAAGAVAIGVEIATTRTIVATGDLAGRVLAQEEFMTDPTADRTLKQIITCARSLTKKTVQPIEGVGISVPGIVDNETGKALFVPFFKWCNWSIKQEVSAALDLPVTVDNDANAAALAELWFGHSEIRGVRDFILVLVEEGLGTGIVFDGQVYHGRSGGAGECGHMKIGTKAPTECAAGSQECWEAFASERAALARYALMAGHAHDKTQLSFDGLMERAEAGHKPAQTALVETAHYLGLGISNLIKCFSPKAVIVAGKITLMWSLIAEPLQMAVEKNSLCSGLSSPPVIRSTLGQKTRLMGSFSLIHGHKFASLMPT